MAWQSSSVAARTRSTISIGPIIPSRVGRCHWPGVQIRVDHRPAGAPRSPGSEPQVVVVREAAARSRRVRSVDRHIATCGEPRRRTMPTRCAALRRRTSRFRPARLTARLSVVVREGPAVGDRARRPDGASVRRGEVDDVAAQAGFLCTSGAPHVEVELPLARRSSFRAAADRAGSLDGPGARRARSRCRGRAVRLSVTGLRNGRQLGKATLRRRRRAGPSRVAIDRLLAR
jgi:hypothetical protein